MRLFLDIDTRSFLVSPSFPRVLAAISVKRRDSDLLELQFIRDRTAQELPAGATVRVGLKALNDFSGGYLAAATFTQSGTGADTVYLTDLNLNTTEVNAAFTAASPEPESIAAMLEVEWSAGTNVSSSLTLPVTLYNDVIRGDEATPAALPDGKATEAQATAGTDNETWMTPLRTAQALAAWQPLQRFSVTWSVNPSFYPVPIGRDIRVKINAYNLATDGSVMLGRSTDGLVAGDRVRFVWLPSGGHGKSLIVTAWLWTGSSYQSTTSTIASFVADGVYGFVFDGNNWVAESEWTGLQTTP